MNQNISLQRKMTWRSFFASLATSCMYLFVAGAFLWALPERAWHISSQAFFAVTLFGLWRYAWQMLHALRSYRYRKYVFPKMRAVAAAVSNPFPKRLYIMIPSYKEEYRISQMVFQALVREVRLLPCEVLFVISVGTSDEAEFISRVVNAEAGGDKLQLVFMYQKDGKRIAMGHALRAVARNYNDIGGWHKEYANDLVVFMDGDTLLLPGTLKKCLPFFKTQPRMAALTTDNLPLQEDGTSIFHDWYALKFMQRHHLFNSHSLSKRILTITGRFSIYKASVVVTEEFIRFVEADYLQNWMFGRIRFLMGDDKSTWFYLLKHGYEMLYVPDAPVVAIEARQERFVPTSLSLMTRWYGNMLRNNARAIALGTKPMGRFIWWCIVDQRLTAWTPLAGPASAIMLAVFISPYYLVYYFSWVIFTRLMLCWAYVLQGFELRCSHIPLMLYNQWVGATVKIFTMYNLDKQVWQKTKGKAQEMRKNSHGASMVSRLFRGWMIAVNVLLVFSLCGLSSGALSFPSITQSIFDDRQSTVVMAEPHDESILNIQDGEDAGGAIMQELQKHVDNKPIKIGLPSGTFYVDTPVRIARSGVTIFGAGVGKTRLVSRLKHSDDTVFAVVGSRGSRVGELTQAYKVSDSILGINATLPADLPVWIAASNTDAFLDSIGSVHWRKQYPYLRQYMSMVSASAAGYSTLENMPDISFPAGSKVHLPEMQHDVVLSDFMLTQQVKGMTLEDVAGVYKNVVPEYAVDGIQFQWARNCKVENVKITMAGRHPISLDNSLKIVIRNVDIDGAWNKGKQGHGYLRIARSYGCIVENSAIKNIRHVTFQWSSTGNTLKNCFIGTDINFHGGYSRNNVVSDSTITPPTRHLWGKVTKMPIGGAAYAPPDGEGNLVLRSK